MMIGERTLEKMNTDFYFRPPAKKADHPHYHKYDRRYSDIPSEEIPLTESLSDVMIRTKSLWKSNIWPDIESGKNVLVVGHTSSIKSLIGIIDRLSPVQLEAIEVPHSIPLMYRFNNESSTALRRYGLSFTGVLVIQCVYLN